MRIVLVCFLVNSAVSELITLHSREALTCVLTEDTVNSPIVVNPPKQSEFFRPSTEINSWKYDDWSLTHSLSSDQAPVVDKRWEDFPVSDKSDGFPLQNNSLSFSVYNTGDLQLTIYSKEFIWDKLLKFTNYFTLLSPRWFHYTLITDGNTIQLLADGKTLGIYELDFDPYWVYVRNSNFWKVHNFSFRLSTSVTQKESSSLSVELTNNLCISMYVSVDEGNFLEVTVQSNNSTAKKRVDGFNKVDGLKTWTRLEVQAESPGVAELSFFRGLENDDVLHGYWAIDDIRFCRRDMEIYQLQQPRTSNSEATCELLSKPAELTTESSEISPCSTPGYIGKDCNIRCDAVLGASYPNCENHKICPVGSPCFCGWGARGSSCTEACDAGTWGLLCNNTCSSQCSECQISTGECLTEANARDNKNPLTKFMLPVNIKASSVQLVVELPKYDKVKGNISYNVKIMCTSAWCQGQVGKEYNFTIRSIFDYKETFVESLEGLLPFTEYKPVVTTQRLDETYEKTFSVIQRKSSDFHGIEDLSIYNSDNTALWVKFRVSPLRANYVLWYHQSNSIIAPLHLTLFSECELWSDYICAEIINLTEATFYSISVESSNLKTQTRELSPSVLGFTSEKASEAPRNLNLRWTSNNGVSITWDHPLITNGPLKQFYIRVESDNTEEVYIMPIEGYPQRSYNHEISVMPWTIYNISVLGVNQFLGEEKKISALILPYEPKNKLPLIEACSLTCFVMVPKPTDLQENGEYDILVTQSDLIKEDKDVIDALERLKMAEQPTENQWLLTKMQNYDEDYFVVNIGKKVGQGVSLYRNTTFSMYLIANNGGEYAIHPILPHGSTATILWPIMLLALLFALSAAGGLLILRNKKSYADIYRNVNVVEELTISSHLPNNLYESSNESKPEVSLITLKSRFYVLMKDIQSRFVK